MNSMVPRSPNIVFALNVREVKEAGALGMLAEKLRLRI